MSAGSPSTLILRAASIQNQSFLPYILLWLENFISLLSSALHRHRFHSGSSALFNELWTVHFDISTQKTKNELSAQVSTDTNAVLRTIIYPFTCLYSFPLNHSRQLWALDPLYTTNQFYASQHDEPPDFRPETISRRLLDVRQWNYRPFGMADYSLLDACPEYHLNTFQIIVWIQEMSKYEENR